MVFWKARSQAETDAFLAATPDPEKGFAGKGQVVLVHEGTPESVVLLTRWDVAPVFEEGPPEDLFVRARAQHLQTLRPDIT